MATSCGGTWWWSMIEDHKFILYNIQNDQVSLLRMIFFFLQPYCCWCSENPAFEKQQQQPPQPPGIGASQKTPNNYINHGINLPSTTGELFEPWDFLPGQPHRAYTSGFTPTVTEVWKLVMTLIPRWTGRVHWLPGGFLSPGNRNGNAESPWILFSFVCHGDFFFKTDSSIVNWQHWLNYHFFRGMFLIFWQASNIQL